MLVSIYFPELRAFLIGFSGTVWTKMMSLAGSLADGMLANAILISSPPTNTSHQYLPSIPPTNIRMVRGPRKKFQN